MRVAQVAQEVLEHLPLAVIGVGDDGIVVLANRKAHEWLAPSDGTLIGLPVENVLPAINAENHPEITLPDGREAAVHRQDFGAPGRPQGKIAVLVTQEGKTG